MKKIGNKIKQNAKIITAFVLGAILTGGTVYAATVLPSSQVGYDNSTSGLAATDVQEALDELNTKTKLSKRSNFIEAYTYSESTCVTGLEDTCIETTCYKTKSANACPAGTIIKYKVNDQEVQTFHVMYDDASTITMQAQKNTIYNTAWMLKADYAAAGGSESSFGTYGQNDHGPLTILKALESATAGWKNVRNQTYTMGTTLFKTNAYTGCSAYNTCDTNTYTLDSRTAKARMITVQEAVLLGCTETSMSCPKWMINYLYNSGMGGGTVNDTSHGPGSSQSTGYWTMNAVPNNNQGWYVYQKGLFLKYSVVDKDYGARAVVVVSK